MNLQKYRWSHHYESAEEELIALLAAKHKDAERWVTNGYEELTILKHDLDKQLWCAEGSIEFTINNNKITLQAGDGLDLPAGTPYQATTGFSGCVCYESPPRSSV